MDTLTQEDVTTVPVYKEPGDDEKFAHYANKDAITSAYLTGTPCLALCGKLWVPTRDPSKFPVCPECQETYARLPKE
jgi:hypothetical protein